MANVGEQLRQAREALGWSVGDVAESTKIKSEHIRALEAGDYESFAAPIYIRGFVRTYATLLKLDTLAVMADLDVELAQTAKFRDGTGASLSPGGGLMFRLSRLNWRFILPVLALVLVALAAVWGLRRWQERRHADPLRDLSPGLYQPADETSGQTLPLPDNKGR
jgi:cytoskeletal protein RodZ